MVHSLRSVAVLLALAASAAPLARGQAPGAATSGEGARLYAIHCVQCHGVDGDGKGATKLERPARSFKDGGFSFGNTKEALAKTIAYGIPGSQMPAFESALKPEERALLAAHVLSFAPESARAPKAGGTELVVGERPVVARGKLPAIDGHCGARTRGLLLGDPSGLSFECDAADLRLVAVRRGAFVDRRDWENRGGDALQPLGRVVSLRDVSAPAWLALGREGGSSTLRAQLGSTSVDGAHPRLVYSLLDERGATAAVVTETLSSATSKAGAGFVRRLWIEAAAPVRVSLLASSASAREVGAARTHGLLLAGGGGGELLVARGCDADEPLVHKEGATRLAVAVAPGRPRLVALESYPLAVVDDAARKALEEEAR